MTDTQYKTLLNKYNILVARCRDLEEQNSINNTHWKSEEERFRRMEMLIRDLCETILAKDHREMVLGENRSWYTTPAEDLIIRAQKSYKEYGKEITRLLNAIQKESEKRRLKIEGLEDQLERCLKENGIAPLPSKQGTVPEPDDLKPTPPDLPDGLHSAAATGKVQLIIEEPGDVEDDKEEILPIAELIEISEQAKITANGIPIKDSVKKAQMIEREKETAVISHLIDLAELEKRFNDSMWAVLSVIGGEGLTKYPEIEQKAVDINSGLARNKLRIAAKELYKMKVLDHESINLPVTPRVSVYKLSDIGVRLYQKKFEKAPVQSEMERVRQEHDNLEHGYGIMDLERILTESGRYKEVRIFNRHNAIEISENKKYVPDIICIPLQGRYSEYIEYERGHHTQQDFNAKCNKMCKVTRFLNFVVPNRGVLSKILRPQIEAWIAERGRDGLRNIKIRITTPTELRMGANDAWLIVYDLNKGVQPVKDNTRKEAETE